MCGSLPEGQSPSADTSKRYCTVRNLTVVMKIIQLKLVLPKKKKNSGEKISTGNL